MRDNTPRDLPEDIQALTPLVPTLSPEPSVLCVIGSGFRLEVGLPDPEPVVLCIKCITKLSQIERSQYKPVSNHYLQVSRIDVNLRCAACDNALVVTRFPFKCRHCRITRGRLLQRFRRYGRSWDNLPEVIRLRSGPAPPLPRISSRRNALRN